MLAGPGLAEEGAEGVIRHGGDGLVAGQLAVRLDAMLHAVELPEEEQLNGFRLKAHFSVEILPAGVAHLDTGLANVDRDTFSHLDDFG